MSEPFLGEIKMVGFNFAPRGWAFCDGQLQSISQHSALFSLLGTVYGGDGRSTFGLPDLRGRDAVHPGNGPGLNPIKQGERTGAETKTLIVSEMPEHSHTLNAANDVANTAGADAGNAYLATAVDATDATQLIKIYNNAPANGVSAMNAASISIKGGGQSFNIRNPLLGIYHCISLTGIFPSRS